MCLLVHRAVRVGHTDLRNLRNLFRMHCFSVCMAIVYPPKSPARQKPPRTDPNLVRAFTTGWKGSGWVPDCACLFVCLGPNTLGAWPGRMGDQVWEFRARGADRGAPHQRDRYVPHHRQMDPLASRSADEAQPVVQRRTLGVQQPYSLHQVRWCDGMVAYVGSVFVLTHYYFEIPTRTHRTHKLAITLHEEQLLSTPLWS
jgi:hypothetical protein